MEPSVGVYVLVSQKQNGRQNYNTLCFPAFQCTRVSNTGVQWCITCTYMYTAVDNAISYIECVLCTGISKLCETSVQWLRCKLSITSFHCYDNHDNCIKMSLLHSLVMKLVCSVPSLSAFVHLSDEKYDR